MGGLLDFAPDLPYAERLGRLLGAGVGLWDVLGSCRRRGSADGAILRSSEKANDIEGVVAAHPGLRTLLLNGGRAEACFRRHCPGLVRPDPAICRLPSTSPAHARPLVEKMAAWRQALAAAGCALVDRPDGSGP
jgi:hypoxanthine-DNA glycosylase